MIQCNYETRRAFISNRQRLRDKNTQLVSQYIAWNEHSFDGQNRHASSLPNSPYRTRPLPNVSMSHKMQQSKDKVKPELWTLLKLIALIFMAHRGYLGNNRP